MRPREHGVAVVLAMGVVALAAMAAAAMLASQSTWPRQVELGAEPVQAQTLIRAGVDWARALLGEDRRASSVDHLGEPWAMRLPPVPVDNGELAGRIDDQQGAFNLNNLARNGRPSAIHLAQLSRLLEVLGLPDALGASLVGWLGLDKEAKAAKPASLADPRRLADVSELALVPGFSEEVRARLRPFVTALPAFTAVNVNTASAEVLVAVVRELSLDEARTLLAQRERAYFRTVAEFIAKLPAGAVVDATEISTASEYFVASMRVTIGAAQARGSALLARGPTGWPAVVWRKYP